MIPIPDVQQMPRDTTHDSAQDTTRQEAQSTTTTPTMPTVPAGQPPTTLPARIGQGSAWALRIVGVVMALGAGTVLGYVLPTMVIPWVFILALVVWEALAAALLQAWWAFLVVPVLSVVGLFVGSSYQAHGFDVQAWFTSGLGDVDVVVVLFVLPWMLAAAVGTLFGVWLKQRMSH